MMIILIGCMLVLCQKKKIGIDVTQKFPEEGYTQEWPGEIKMTQQVKSLVDAKCNLYATEGTAAMITAMGFPVTMTTKKLNEGHPNVLML